MPDPILDPLRERAHRELLRYIVSRKIFCQVTGAVLDVRTCVVFVDNDGDPVDVVSQSGWVRLVEICADRDENAVEVLASQGYFLDRSTVKP